MLPNVSRRTVLVELSRGAAVAVPAILGVSAMAPLESAAQAAKVLKTRAYLALSVLDPANRLSAADGDVIGAIFAGLIKWKAGSKWEWEKDLATEIEQTDPTHIRFQLRRGVQWTNGFGWDWAGRLTSRVTGEPMYVFKPMTLFGLLYLKVVIRTDCIVVSFHEEVET